MMKNCPITSTPLQIRILFSTKYRIITSKKIILSYLPIYLPFQVTEIPILHLIIAHDKVRQLYYLSYIYGSPYRYRLIVWEGCVLLASRAANAFSDRTISQHLCVFLVCIGYSDCHRNWDNGCTSRRARTYGAAKIRNRRPMMMRKGWQQWMALFRRFSSLTMILVRGGCEWGVKITNILYKVVEGKGVNIERRSAKDA